MTVVKKITTIDAYIDRMPKKTAAIIKKLRRMVRTLAPESEESVSYGMPAFKLFGKPLVYMAGWERHVGLYATPSANAAFKADLQSYHVSKGAIQFPLDMPMPYDLVKKIILFKIEECKKSAEKVCSRGHVFYKSRLRSVCPQCWPGKYKKR